MPSKLTRFLLLAVVSAMCSGLYGCAPEESPEVPAELQGVWITDDPRYDDRFLKLEKDTIHFGMGGDQATENPIIDVEELPVEGSIVYRIKYLSPEGLEYSQSLYYDQQSEEIRYKSRPSVVWKRVEIEIKPAESAQSAG
jgi:hypothetical protein